MEHQEEVAVLTKKALAKELGISRASLYYTPKREEKDTQIKQQIETVWKEHPAYGHKRLALALNVNRKCILRVMHKYEMKPYRRRCRKPVKPEDQGKEASPIHNRVKHLCPIHPNVVWVTDFTYIPYHERFLYLATIMDRYTREVIGKSVSWMHTSDLVVQALQDAFQQSRTAPYYLHMDQGSEYTSQIFMSYVMLHAITLSYSRKGSPWENGYQESFYAGFKLDLGSTTQFETEGELIAAVYQTIQYYNTQRIHTALKMSPVAFRNSVLQTTDAVSKEMGT